MKKRLVWIMIFAALAVLAACVWKLNGKINNLFRTVQQLTERTEQLSAEIENLKEEAAEEETDDFPNLQPEDGTWMVTQFGDVDGQQEMCYTITTDTGLVIVDGGYAQEVPRLRRIIASYGNRVEAWILTHPHADHITAFMDIYEDLQGIEIAHVYTTDLPDEERMKENAAWDDYAALERFRSMEISQLEYVYTGDQLQLLGLEVEILSAYSDKTDELSNDLMNDGSLVFRIRGNRESMLFCADVGKSLTSYLIEQYGESLQSDYVQMGHHGFGGPGDSFYELVSPRAAFFDAPSWLMTSETERSALPKVQLMQELGCVIFSYYTAPNQILLY